MCVCRCVACVCMCVACVCVCVWRVCVYVCGVCVCMCVVCVCVIGWQLATCFCRIRLSMYHCVHTPWSAIVKDVVHINIGWPNVSDFDLIVHPIRNIVACPYK